MLFSFLLLFYSSVCGFSGAYPRQVLLDTRAEWKGLNKNAESDNESAQQQLVSASTAALRKASAYALESKRASLPEMKAIATNMAVECLHRARELWDASQQMADSSSADMKRKFGGRIPVSYSLNSAAMALCTDAGPQVESKAVEEVTSRRGEIAALLGSLVKKSEEPPLDEEAIAERSDANEEFPRTRSASIDGSLQKVDDYVNEKINPNELQYTVYDYDDGLHDNNFYIIEPRELAAFSNANLADASLTK